jgi:hypothetical protein
MVCVELSGIPWFWGNTILYVFKDILLWLYALDQVDFLANNCWYIALASGFSVH